MGRDGQTEPIMPSDARLRNLTYACPLKVDVTVQDVTRDGDSGALATPQRVLMRRRVCAACAL